MALLTYCTHFRGGMLMKFLVIIMCVVSSLSYASEKRASISYGEDNRVDVEDVEFLVGDLSHAIAGRLKNNFLRSLEDSDLKKYLITPKLSSHFGMNVCTDEKFADQITAPDCTGFLVSENLLVTAGHCMVDTSSRLNVEIHDKMNKECAQNSWLFDFKTTNGLVELNSITPERVYGCKRVVHAKLDSVHDFAVIELDRKVINREPLKIRRSGKVSDKTELFVIGHPSGLPMKFTNNAVVMDNSKKAYFSSNLDTFGGNSGSPVFNAQTMQVEGILVRGRTDYVPSWFDENCMRVNQCSQDGMFCLSGEDSLKSEEVTRISEVLKFL
jgi:V8-like Glu-specific endopeptidase